MTQTYFNIKRLLVSNIGTLPLDTELSAGCDLTAAAGDGIFNFGSAEGAFTTSTGTNTLSGNVVIAGTKTFATGSGAITLNGTVGVAAGVDVIAAGAGSDLDFVLSDGIFRSPTGENTLGGNVTISGSKTFATGTGAIGLNGNVTLAATKGILKTAGIGDFDFSLGTGTFKTTSGENTVMGNLTINGTKTFASGTGSNTFNGHVVIAADKNFTMTTPGTGTFATGTGAATLNGDTTVATSKALTVTTADKLTVGGVIVPQYDNLVVPINASSVDQWAFIAKYACQVTNVSVIYTVVGGSGATVDVKKSITVEAPASGATMLTAAVALTATANTVYTPTLAAAAACQLAAGNTIGIDLSGTLTGLVGGIVVITMMRI